MAQATPSKATAATPKIHDAIPYQRPPTPLGILGRFPAEIRNQLYRDVFHGQKATSTSQWHRQRSSSRPEHFFGILRTSRSIRLEVEPYFYRYCQFSLDVSFTQDKSRIAHMRESQSLQRKLPRMHNIVFESRPNRGGVLDGSLIDQIAFIPIEPQDPDDRSLAFPNIFEDVCVDGREMVFHFMHHLDSGERSWQPISFRALQAVFITFQQYETVKFQMEICRTEETMGASPRSITQGLQIEIEKILGPGTNVLLSDERLVYEECIEFRPKSHFEAKAKGKGLQ